MNLPGSLFPPLLIAQFVSLSSTAARTTFAPKPPRLTTKLIHRNSIFSPYYNPSSTVRELNQEALHRSRAHVQYIQERMTAARMNGGLLNNDVLSLGLIADNAGISFLANVSIGQPPVPQLLNVDTGSSLLWVRCKPCNGCPRQAVAFFDPSKSSTYAAFPCTSWSQICGDSSGTCSLGKCTFSMRYFDGTVVLGDIASEQLLFETTDEGNLPVHIKVFGCANTNTGPTDSQESGLLGLGPAKFSVLKQLGGKFSHCFGGIHDPKYEHNMLVFGEGAIFEGDVTPMETYLQLYYVTLEGISVGEEKLDIDPSVFKIGELGEGGAFVDSGTTFTIIVKGGYDPLREKVESLLDQFLQRTTFQPDPQLLCYKGQVDLDLIGFPAVAFHFAQGTDIVLDTHSMFLQMKQNVPCMAVEPSNDKMMNVTVIGNLALQFHNVGYDIDAGKMYVQRIDCQLLQS